MVIAELIHVPMKHDALMTPSGNYVLRLSGLPRTKSTRSVSLRDASVFSEIKVSEKVQGLWEG